MRVLQHYPSNDSFNGQETEALRTSNKFRQSWAVRTHCRRAHTLRLPNGKVSTGIQQRCQTLMLLPDTNAAYEVELCHVHVTRCFAC
eukprot:944022-Amphidinium_carterae.1